MQDERKSKMQLIAELGELRQEIAELQAAEAEYHKTRSALQESEARYRQFTELSPDAIFVHCESRIVFINAAGANMLGAADPEELIGRPVMDLIHPDYEEVVRKRAHRALEEGKSGNRPIVEKLVRLDGQVIDVEVTLTRLVYQDQPAVVVVARDITKRAKMEVQRNAALQTLKDAELEKETILDSQLEHVVYQDREHRILWPNQAACESVGATRDELIGRHCYEIWPQRSQPCEDCPIALTMKTGQRQEGEQTTPDGRTWFIRGNPVRDADGEIVGAIEVTQDITQRVRSEETLRRRAEEMTALQSTVLDITTQHNLSSLLQTIVERAVRLMNGSGGGLYLCDSDRETVHCVVSHNMPPGFTGPELRYGESAAVAVAQTGEPLLIEDYRSWSGRAKVYEEEQPFTALLSVPMLWQSQVTGVIHVLGNGESRRFTQTDLELLTTFANHAAIAVHNAEMYEQVQAHSRHLETLQQINATLRSTLPLDKVLETIARSTGEALGYLGTIIAIPDTEGERLTLSAVWNDRFIKIVMQYTGLEMGTFNLPLTVEENPMARVYRTGELEHWTGLPEEIVAGVEPTIPTQVTHIVARAMGTNLGACVPLSAGDRVVGLLIVFSPRDQMADEERAALIGLADQAGLAIHNAQLYQAVQQELVERKQAEEALRWERDRAMALEEATAVVSNTLDPDQVLDRILEEITRVIPYDATNIMLVEGHQARVVRWRGYERFGEEEQLSTLVFQVPETLILRRMTETGDPLVVPDTATYPGWVRIPPTGWISSYASAPIIVRDEVIGFLNVDSATPGFFTQAHADTLRAFADHAAVAIQNARLYEAEQERRQIAETLRQASTVLSSTLELNEVLDLILEQLRQVIPYDSASIQQLQGDSLRLTACRGFEAPDKIMGLVFPLDPKFPNHQVVTTKTPLAIEDIAQDYPHFEDEADTYASGHIRSWLGVPLMVKDQIIGMIALDRVAIRPYTAEEAQLAMAFANQAAIAIENARLFAETEHYRAFNESIVQTVPGAITVTSVEGNFTFINPATVELLGYTPEELLGQHWSVIFPPDQQPIIKAADERRMRGESDRYEVELLRKDGTRVPALVSGSPWFDIRMGHFAGTLAVVTDISQRVQIEQALRESEERYRQSIENSPNPIYSVNREGAIQTWNRACERLFQYSSEEIIGQMYHKLLWNPEDRPVVEAMMTQVLENRPVDDMDLSYRCKDGVQRFTASRLYPLVDHEGNIKGCVFTNTDITGRVQAEAELRRRNRGLTLLNQIIAASASGMEPQAMLETACRELARTFDLPRVVAALLNEEKTEVSVVAEYLIEGQPTTMGAILPVKGNPSYQYLLSNKAPLVIRDAQNDPRLEPVHNLARQLGAVSLLLLPLNIGGELLGSLGLVDTESGRFSAEDVSLAWSVADQVAGALTQARLNEQRQHLEEQYRQAQKMEAVGRLTAGIAHDFNNLLTAINGFAELTRLQLLPDDPLHEMVEKILHSGRRAADLVRQLLAFSRKQIIEPQVLNLNAVVAEMEKMLRRVIGEDIELRTSPAPDLWLVKVDPTQIGQVLANLAVNARDAMPEGGQLIVETANVTLDKEGIADHLDILPGQYVMLSVSDTGIGMSDEVKAHLFEPFFTTKEPGKGTGLGLATVYGVVKQSGGDIRVHSQQDEGTTFEIYLPRVGEVIPTPVRPRGMADVPSGDETILLVEDDENVRDLTWRVLEGQGYTVLKANNGQEAIQVAAGHPDHIHLLLTDLVMPGISGKVLAEQLTQAQPDLKVLFMSGYTDELIAGHGMLEPSMTLLQKPFRPVQLAHKVRQVLDMPQSS
jgi:two-component system cell cycle sensor histidine kinase/response regulator CckA